MARKPILLQDPSSGIYRAKFRIGPKQYLKSLKTNKQQTADRLAHVIHKTLNAIEDGFVSQPPESALWPFLLSGGKTLSGPISREVSLTELFQKYESLLPDNSLEPSTRLTYEIHKSHLLRIIGGDCCISEIRPQEYVVRRSQESWQGRPIQGVTIRKELATLRAVFNIGVEHGLTQAVPNFKKLSFGKSKDKLPFMTWAEIEEKVALGGSPDLWDCLFLSTAEIEKCLEFVKNNAKPPWVYPAFVFVAKTGARRSEMVRVRLEDVNLEKGEVVLREKKRDKRFLESFRRVYLSPSTVEVLKQWVAQRVGGPMLFGDITPRMATFYFVETLKGSPWEVIKGWHVFRHSHASNLAAAGTDQRIIDELMGHQTEAMRRRYRHLAKNTIRAEINRVYQ